VELPDRAWAVKVDPGHGRQGYPVGQRAGMRRGRMASPGTGQASLQQKYKLGGLHRRAACLRSL
jgi:hypothetical protein